MINRINTNTNLKLVYSNNKIKFKANYTAASNDAKNTELFPAFLLVNRMIPVYDASDASVINIRYEDIVKLQKALPSKNEEIIVNEILSLETTKKLRKPKQNVKLKQ